MRVFIASGDFNHIFPCQQTERLVVEELRAFSNRVTFKCYVGGHMMYDAEAGARELSRDVRSFLAPEAKHPR